MATPEEKELYVSVIEAIWGGTIQGNSANYISDEVIGLVDNTLDAIRECSKGIAMVEITFRLFYAPHKSWAEVLKQATKSGITRWIDHLKDSKYDICVKQAAWQYKTAVASALATA